MEPLHDNHSNRVADASMDRLAAEEAFEKALLASGLVKEIKRPSSRPAWDRPLVQIQGEPLSETIIRERR